eukprot:TRINITY_DN11081_c0_g1_i1.p1 TRINITY_DN11081_c0_g1~~TRINITY_DN11081_c0_g1_i1.p1  ORF type:complete len:141 (+),score=28.97 TRINITY_DN11081_c0_g1_i1:181-603(+)
MDPVVAFATFSDGKHYLNIDDLSCAMISVFGMKMKKAELRDLIAEHVPVRAAGLSQEGFLAVVEERRKLLGEQEQARSMFVALDGDGDGKLDLGSFEVAVAEACRPAGTTLAQMLFRDMDRSRCGIVSFADFEAYLNCDA